MCLFNRSTALPCFLMQTKPKQTKHTQTELAPTPHLHRQSIDQFTPSSQCIGELLMCILKACCAARRKGLEPRRRAAYTDAADVWRTVGLPTTLSVTPKTGTGT